MLLTRMTPDFFFSPLFFLSDTLRTLTAAGIKGGAVSPSRQVTVARQFFFFSFFLCPVLSLLLVIAFFPGSGEIVGLLHLQWDIEGPAFVLCVCCVTWKKKEKKKRMRTEWKSNISVRGDVETHPRLKIEIKKRQEREEEVWFARRESSGFLLRRQSKNSDSQPVLISFIAFFSFPLCYKTAQHVAQQESTRSCFSESKNKQTLMWVLRSSSKILDETKKQNKFEL